MQRLALLLGLLCALGGAVACDSESDGDGDADVDGDVDGDVDADADADGGGGGFLVEVRALPLAWGDPSPAEGAAVALDLPSGERVEDTTGADGRVDLDAPDWSGGGEISVTAYLEGYTLGGYARLGEDDVAARQEEGALVILLFPRNDHMGYVQLSGEITGRESTSSRVVVGASVPNMLHDGATDDWSMQVLGGVELDLVAVEYSQSFGGSASDRRSNVDFYQWALLHQDALSGDATLDIAFGEGTTPDPLTVTGSYTLPPHEADSFFGRANCFVRVTSLAALGGIYLGGPRHCEPSEDGSSIEFEAEYLPVDGLEQVMTAYMMMNNSSIAMHFVEGYPTDGSHEVDLPLPPEITTPAAGQAAAITDEISWTLGDAEGADESLDVVMVIASQTNEDMYQYFTMPPGTTSGTFPAPPSGTPDEAAFGSGPARGHVRLCESPDDVWCHRFGRSRFFSVTR